MTTDPAVVYQGLKAERDNLSDENERLRAALNPWTHAHWSHQSFVDGCYPCVLIQQNDELRAENERLHVQVMETARECGIQKTDNERLRAALTEIIDFELEGDASLDDAIRVADETLHPPPLDSPNRG